MASRVLGRTGGFLPGLPLSSPFPLTKIFGGRPRSWRVLGRPISPLGSPWESPFFLLLGLPLLGGPSAGRPSGEWSLFFLLSAAPGPGIGGPHRAPGVHPKLPPSLSAGSVQGLFGGRSFDIGFFSPQRRSALRDAGIFADLGERPKSGAPPLTACKSASSPGADFYQKFMVAFGLRGGPRWGFLNPPWGPGGKI